MKKQFKRAILAAGMMVMLSATTGISALATQTNNINGQTARASVPLVQPPKVQIPGGDQVVRLWAIRNELLNLLRVVKSSRIKSS